MQRFSNKATRLLASRKFFIFILALLVFQAVWLALSFKYAMLWDEEYHLGLIQFYSHHLSPLITHQPHSLDMLGEVTRSPKYLYHWLMSFPFRLVTVFTHDAVAQIVAMRFINIALFAGGLIAFRAAMLRITRSKALVHFTLLVFVLLPISSLLAAQINYDNMLFPLAGLIFYWSFRYVQSKPLDLKWLVLVLGIGLLTTVVEYNFIPVFGAIIIYLVFWTIKNHRRELRIQTKEFFASTSKWAIIGLTVLVLLGLGLTGERFGYNLARYHKLNPDCSQILSINRCLKTSAYQQGHRLSHKAKASGKSADGPVRYLFANWLGQIYEQYFNTGQRIVYGVYVIELPLPLPIVAGSAAALAALFSLTVLIKRRQLHLSPEFKLVAWGGLALCLVLFVFDYKIYLQTHAPLAIQGRYLLPMAPLVMLYGFKGISKVTKKSSTQAMLGTLMIVGLLAGGGLLTDIIRSEPNWYWSNQTVKNVNLKIKDSLDFLTLGLNKD